MNSYDIDDKRTRKSFKGITFSNYKKSEAKKQLLNSLINGKIEPACYWSIEYICAGHFLDLWDVILLFSTKYIHLGNPKLPLYLQLRFNNFKDILVSGYVGNEIRMRNNKKIRIMFAEIISILCLSTKKHSITQVKIEKTNFNMTEITEKLKADNVGYATKLFAKGDPKELFIAVNEFAYHLSKKSNNVRDACYWFEWIIEFESICKREKKNRLVCSSRHIAPVESKYSTDVAWMLWEAIFVEVDKRGAARKKIAAALLELYSMKYRQGYKRRRRFVIYNAISIVTETLNLNTPIYRNPDKIENVKKKINIVYKQVKKNEIRPDTDYLFNNSITNGSNLERTIQKLDKMSSVIGFIPRSN